jgi:hypothetical protein
MTPMQLDYIINGAKVFIYKRPDGTAYASVHDFSRFGTPAIETLRIKLASNSTIAAVLNDPKVRERISTLTPQQDQSP